MPTIYARKTDIQRVISEGEATIFVCTEKSFSDCVALVEKPEATPAPKITADTPVDYSNDTIRKHAELLVQQNVNYCVSSLVSSLCKLTGEGSALDALDITDDEIYSIASKEDWETPAREWIDRADRDELIDAYEYAAIGMHQGALPEDVSEEDARAHLIGVLEDTDNWQDFCDYEREDPHTVEAYEHWIVDSWFAARLEEMGEMIARDFLGLTIWGRTTTGQSICMDHVILTIARDALISE